MVADITEILKDLDAVAITLDRHQDIMKTTVSACFVLSVREFDVLCKTHRMKEQIMECITTQAQTARRLMDQLAKRKP